MLQLTFNFPNNFLSEQTPSTREEAPRVGNLD